MLNLSPKLISNIEGTLDFMCAQSTCPVKILTRATFPLYSHHESQEDDGGTGVIILIIVLPTYPWPCAHVQQYFITAGFDRK